LIEEAMILPRLFFALVVAVAGVAAGATAAAAQNVAAAEAAFTQGRALMKAGKYAEACAAFAQSQQIDPQMGTLWNLGQCQERAGQTASAWVTVREVAQRDTNKTRRGRARKLASALEPKLTRVLITVDAPPPGLVVTSNGADVTAQLGLATPVDAGTYVVVARAPGFGEWTATVEARGEGRTLTAAIPALAPEAPPPPVEPAPPSIEPGLPPIAPVPRIDPGPRQVEPAPITRGGTSGRRQLGIGLVVGGVVIAGAGLGVGALARSKWSEVRALCGDDLVCDDAATFDEARTATDAARLRGNLSTALVAAGGVAANQAIRKVLHRVGFESGTVLVAPPPALCTDNGAMIAWAGAERLALGLIDSLDTAPRARWPLDEVSKPSEPQGLFGRPSA
jgi:tRNA N6-adenosine threonylcarbamoyltransferase